MVTSLIDTPAVLSYNPNYNIFIEFSFSRETSKIISLFPTNHMGLSIASEKSKSGKQENITKSSKQKWTLKKVKIIILHPVPRPHFRGKSSARLCCHMTRNKVCG